MDMTSSFSIQEGKTIRCKAAICRKAGEALVTEEIQVYPPQAYEVRIKILCTTLCHTDLAFSKYESVRYTFLFNQNKKIYFFCMGKSIPIIYFSPNFLNFAGTTRKVSSNSRTRSSRVNLLSKFKDIVLFFQEFS